MVSDSRLRVTKIDEVQFLTCLKYGLWGSKSARFSDWKPGDQLVFIVDKALAGVAEVEGEPFFSKEQVWSNGTYPHRIGLKFKHVLAAEDRAPILGPVRELFIDNWGTNYGWAILNQMALVGNPAQKLLDEIITKPNALSTFKANLEDRLIEAIKRRSELPIRNAKAEAVKSQTSKREKVEEVLEAPEASEAEESNHTRL